ncbi:hypothetical protein DTL21_07815 [Bremerella cremea]|uniref:Uncharacterized protein n=1 Tax=Blastopirellula marina TaxID=124 RepID=A0A2S8G071_9BACT|nr:hypothetical protein C5Y83_07810 [Blastopirellula marina]RCS50226.1 hypothetical protein DTL21_07815 [Bremerella cremea]
MICDQLAHLESRRRALENQLELLHSGKWWHVGTDEAAEQRMLEELKEIRNELAHVQSGMRSNRNVR